jgi:hypothetical protein
MKFTRTLALIIGTALLIAACSKEPDEATAVVAVKVNTNPLLAYVPADTAYVFAALEPAPKEITDVYVSRFQPVLDVMSKHIDQFRTDYAAGEFQDNEMARFATALFDELGGDLSSESLAKLGISMQAHHAFYAMGVFPVIRLGLSDAQELRNVIARIETKMDFKLPVKELNGTSYWRIAEDGMPAGMYIAILDQQLAISAFPVSAEDGLLAAFLGQEMPANSLASSNALSTMNSKKGYTNYGSGFLDIQKLAEEMLNPDSATRTYLGPDISADFESFDAVCIAETKSMIAKAPRMTAGTTRLTANEIAMRYELEIESSLASGLVALVSDIPAATQGDYLLSASLAVQVGKLRNFVLEKVNALVASPFQCEMLQQLNQDAAELVTQLNIPMPPMINNLMGVRIRVDDLDRTTVPPRGTGLLAIHVDKPEMFIGMASMMVPGFDALDIANQTDPVRIPADMMPMEGLDVFALMGDNAIGVAIGEQNAKDLGEFMAVKPQDKGTFLSVSYDMAKQMEIQLAVSEKMGIKPGGDQSPVEEFSEAVRESYKSMLGRSRVDMRFSGDGLLIDSAMTFK